MPRGDATSYKFQASASEPQMKSPDAIYSMEESFEQYGVYYDQYRVFVIPTNLLLALKILMGQYTKFYLKPVP
ncbi:MAG: hypothetical protein ACI8P3_004096 [Saprospiraceae bacterium]|jgi:hypothetical protein